MSDETIAMLLALSGGLLVCLGVWVESRFKNRRGMISAILLLCMGAACIIGMYAFLPPSTGGDFHIQWT